jgi:hypothetical protein
VFGPLSCVSPTFCMDAGFGGNTLTWNGKAWRELPTPKPAGSTDFNLSGVSCTSASFCMAVGWNAKDPDGIIHQTVAETWNGSAWKIIPSPAHKQESTFKDVSCSTAQHCMAIGSFFIHRRPTFTAFNIAGLWIGKGWTVMHLPGAVGDPFGFDLGNQGLASISCATSSSCMAAGSFVKFGTQQPGSLAIAWNGTRWRLTTPRGPKGGVADVSCAAATRCIAVGHAGIAAMAQRWNGTSWTLMKTAGSSVERHHPPPGIEKPWRGLQH